MTETTVGRPAALRSERVRFLARERLRDRRFWFVQAGILLVSGFHVAVEWTSVDDGDLGTALGLDEWPVMLYIIPVVYAGIVFGREGGLLAGIESAVLATPMLLVWHRADFHWVGELVYLAIVVGVGIAITVPVERERAARTRAEANAGRLALLGEVATELGSVSALHDAIEAALGRVLSVMDLERVGLRGRHADGEPIELEVERQAGDDQHKLAPDVLDQGTQSMHFPIVSRGDVVGELTIVSDNSLEAEDRDLLAAISSQLGVAIEKNRLFEIESQGLRTYVHTVTSALEEERARLARELHDDAAQALVALSRALDDLSEHVADTDSTKQALDGLRSLAGEVLDSIRRFSRDLRPRVLDDLGLVPALEWLAADFYLRSGVETSFELEGDERRLPSEVELALFRITQEALRNVEKHARATNVVVSVVFESRRLAVSVKDDGCGFRAPDPLVNLTGEAQLGLIGMRERAALVGASLGLESRPADGTNVTVDLPIA